MNLVTKWKEIVTKFNSQGIPLPTARDPKSGQGSVTFSLVVVSGGLCVTTILIMLGTCLAKLSTNFVLNPETSVQIHDAFVSSFQFLIASLSAYLGRKMQSGNASLDADQPKS